MSLLFLREGIPLSEGIIVLMKKGRGTEEGNGKEKGFS